MDAARGDTDLGTEAELAAIGELGGCIVQHDGAVDPREEALCHILVLGDDRIRMARGPAFNMCQRAVEAIDHGDGKDGRKVFRAPIFLGRGLHARDDRAGTRIAAQLAAGVDKRGRNPGEQCVGHGGINQQRFERAADAGAAHLGIDHEVDSLLRIGRPINIHVAEALEVADHRHAGVLLHTLDQAAATARYDDIDLAIKAGQHLADSGAVGGADKLYCVRRQAFGLKRRAHGIDEGVRGMRAFRSAAQDGGIAGAQAERSRICSHVRAAFVNDSDDTQRHGHAGKVQSVRLLPARQFPTKRIGQVGNGIDAGRDAVDTRLIEGEAVEHGVAEALFPGRIHVLLVGRQNGRRGSANGGGNRLQATRAIIRAEAAQGAGCGTGASPHVQHGFGEGGSGRWRLYSHAPVVPETLACCKPCAELTGSWSMGETHVFGLHAFTG